MSLLMFLSLLVICLLAITATESSPQFPREPPVNCANRVTLECCGMFNGIFQCGPPVNNGCPPGFSAIDRLE
ncbi:hypothetical protein KIN20_011796 [Parelaphostrongylus tenuis]|uniref:Uncharacterized protein n=1 Tax=Parelaphostrongylus tenuis TaxID=148309 RepID=A0AAD5M9Z6_PARTN|nr:hypothetical protein KIN20_011796 [Parelaphostrongylus tenuis]